MRLRPTLLLALLAVSVLAVADVPEVRGATPARLRQKPPEATAQGEFGGTWYRLEPGWKQALFVRRSDEGAWQVRLYWETEEGFLLDTAWAERHEFVYRGLPGVFEIVIDKDKSTDAAIVARCTRRQQGTGGRMLEEEGEVRLYRSSEGQNLVWLQDPLRSRVTMSEPISPYQEDEKVRELQRLWIFQRAARRLVELDEIPW